MDSQISQKTTFLASVFGNCPRLQIVLRGYRFEIVGRFGRTVSHSKGTHAIQWAWKELQEPGKVLPFKRKEPWQTRIDSMNAKCEEMQRRVAEGRI